MKFPKTKRTSSIEPQREPTWWTSAPARDEHRALQRNSAKHRLSPVARIQGPTLASFCQCMAGIEGGHSPGRHALTGRICRPWSLAYERLPPGVPAGDVSNMKPASNAERF